MSSDRDGSGLYGKVLKVRKVQRIAEKCFIVYGDGGEVFGVAANRYDYFSIGLKFTIFLGRNAFVMTSSLR